MIKENLKILTKCLILGILVTLILFVLGNILIKRNVFDEIETALFIEGILCLFIGLFSAISGNTRFLGGSGNFLVKSIEHETKKIGIKVSKGLGINMGISSVVLIIGGVITIISSYII